MPKVKISEYSTTNTDNSDIEGINIAEGCAPSGINNAIRELMVHLKEFQTGSSGDPLTVAGAFVASGGTTANTMSVTGILTASGGTVLSGTNTMSGAAVISGNINSSGTTNTFSGGNVLSGTNTLSGTTIISGNATISGTTNTISGAAIISGDINSSGTNTFSGSQIISGSINSSGSTNTFSGNTIFSVNSSSDAVRITQTGAGNALVVEDSSNPDATPFVVDASGNVIRGYTSAIATGAFTIPMQLHAINATAPVAGYSTFNWADSGAGPGYTFYKSRGGVIGTPAIVSSGDNLGRTAYYAYDGASWIEGARVQAEVDGTPGTNDMPGRLVFSTTADGASSPTERMRITNAGNVGIGLTPSTKLDVLGSGQFRPAATQDAIVIAGRAGGTSSYAVTLTPTTLSANRTLTLPDSTTTVVGTDTTQTLTNKRITPRVSTTTSSATPTINTDTTDVFGLTAQAADITSFTTNLSGTPTDGQKLHIYIVGTAARAITWGASFEASTVALPTTTVSTNRLDVGFVWNAATSKWRCLATA